jgi:hypothetical protein
MIQKDKETLKGHDKYLDYRKRTKDKPDRLDKTTFRKVLNLFNQKVIDKIIFDNFEFNMPSLGILSLRKRKLARTYNGKINSKVLSIDWPKTKEFKTPIYLMNEHSDGYRYTFDFKKHNYKNKKYYKFHMSRHNKRYLAQILKNPDIYGKIDAYIK